MKTVFLTSLALLASATPLPATETSAPVTLIATPVPVTVVQAGQLLDRPDQPARGPSTIIIRGDPGPARFCSIWRDIGAAHC